MSSVIGVSSRPCYRDGVAYVVINGGNEQRPNHQQPVCDGHIELAMEDLGGMDHLNLRKVGEFHHLSEKLQPCQKA
jgi:hypothetical protein